MTGYRGEEARLRLRIDDARDTLWALDRRKRQGNFARTEFARQAYHLGRYLARHWRRWRSPADATQLARLRDLAERLEKRVSEVRPALNSELDQQEG